jgi:Bacterial Ig domain
MTRKRVFGVLGVAATLSLTTNATATAAAHHDGSAPRSPDSGATGAARPRTVPVTAYYGATKFHVGVKLADGTYDTSNPPKLGGAEFEVVETGPSAGAKGLTTTCLMDLGSDPGAINPFPNEQGYHYFCNFHPNDLDHYPNGYYTYFPKPSDHFKVHQVTAPAGVAKDPLAREPAYCIDPAGGSGLCEFQGEGVDFLDTGAVVAANFKNVVNHGNAQTIDAIAKSQTAGQKPTIAISKRPAHGTAVITANKIVYTPKSTYGGPDDFTYTLKTATSSSVGTVHMSVQVPPIAHPDTAHTTGGRTTPGQAVSTAVLRNDLARGGGALKGLTVTVKPKHGTAHVAGKKIVYTPATGFHGKDVLTYLIKNKYGSAKAKLTIHVAKP